MCAVSRFCHRLGSNLRLRDLLPRVATSALSFAIAVPLHGCSLFDDSANVPADGSVRQDGGSPSQCGSDCDCVSKVEAGEYHTCAILDDGHVRCWGANESGQSGAGGSPVLKPQQVVLPSAALDVALGSYHTCAALEGGEVWCWGDNKAGQLGTASGESMRGPTVLAFAEPFTSLSAHLRYTCGVTKSARVHCWGEQNSVLGSNPYVQRADRSELDHVVALATGNHHACALRDDDSIWCWGRNNNGEFGTAASQTAHAVASGFVPALKISAGAYHTCSVSKSDGKLACSGWTGLGEDYFGATPMALDTQLPLVQIASGDNFGCGVDVDGGGWCWGSNMAGQLAEASALQSKQPLRTVEHLSSITTGKTHACAIRDSGELVCWGANESGQLGDGTTGSRPTPTPVDVQCSQ